MSEARKYSGNSLRITGDYHSENSLAVALDVLESQKRHAGDPNNNQPEEKTVALLAETSEEGQQTTKAGEEQTSWGVVEHFLGSTTAHGLGMIPNEDTLFRKLFWFILYLLGLSICICIFRYPINKYIMRDISVKTTLVKMDSTGFPAVTVCNMNKLRMSSLAGSRYENLTNIFLDKLPSEEEKEEEKNNTLSIVKQMITKYPALLEHAKVLMSKFQLLETDVEHFLYEVATTYGHDYMNANEIMIQARTKDLSDVVSRLRPSQKELDNFGHQINDFLVQCSYNKVDCYREFLHTYSETYGNCFTFNHALEGKEILWTGASGAQSGLRLTLNLEPDEYLGLFSHEVGARVSVHPGNVAPFPEHDGINTLPGSLTSIAVSKNMVYRQPPPYTSNCTYGKHLNLFYNGSYTLKNCQLSCLRHEMLQRCKCVDTVVRQDYEPLCLDSKNYAKALCREEVLRTYTNGQLQCQSNCQPPCQEEFFETKTSYAVWPSPGYSEVLRYQLNRTRPPLLIKDTEDARRRLTRVHVYLSSLNVLITEETPETTWCEMLADIGGQLGLFLGMSSVTCVEMMVCLIDILTIACKKLPGSNSKDNPSVSSA